MTCGDEFATLYGLFPLVDRTYEKAKLVLRVAFSADPLADEHVIKLTPQILKYTAEVLQEPLLASFSRYK